MENTSGSRYKSTLKCGLILPFSLKEYETSPIVQFFIPNKNWSGTASDSNNSLIKIKKHYKEMNPKDNHL